MAYGPTVPFKIDVLIGEEDPIDDRCINIGESILNAFKSRPDFIGQVDAMTGAESTFQQMRERSVKCALWLKKLGVQRNDVIIVYSNNHFNTYIPYLATLYIGAILSVWDENQIMNLRYFLMKSSPKVIFTDFDKAPCILKVARIMNISTTIVIFEKKSKAESNEINTFISMVSILNDAFDKTEIDEFSCVELESSKDTAIIIFACGVTGAIPKDVVIPHTFFIAPSNQEAPVMISDDVGLWPASLSWNISLLLTVRAILSYVKAIKFHGLFEMDDQSHLCYLIKKYKVTWIFLETTMCCEFPPHFTFKNSDISSLKQLLIGGTPFLNGVYKEFICAFPNILVIQVYCLPETGVIAYQRKEKFAFNVGKNVHLVFVDIKNNLPVKPYRIGVLWCKSPSLLNADSISTTLTMTATDNNGWFHTEDVGYYEPNGNIYILDRGEHNIKHKNEILFISIILEHLIRYHPEVYTAAVVFMSHDFYRDHLMILVVRKKNSKLTEEKLKQFIAEYLNIMDFRTVILFDVSVPILPNGFLDRKEICKRAAQYLYSKMPSRDHETSLWKYC